MDFVAIDRNFSFDACETRTCINVIVVDDSIIEMDEFFIFSLKRTANLNARIDLDPVNGTICIIDNEGT